VTHLKRFCAANQYRELNKMPREPKVDRIPDRGGDAEDLCADGAFTVKEAVHFSGLARTAIYQRIEDGSLPSLRLGRRRLIPKRALVRMLAEGLANAIGEKEVRWE
jgi:excisionase family DNA binding protein